MTTKFKTIFALGNNPFRPATVTREVAPPNHILDKFTLASYYAWVGKPVTIKEAAAYFKANLHCTHWTAIGLLAAGCVVRSKQARDGAVANCWEYVYEFVSHPVRILTSRDIVYIYLVARPNSTSVQVKEGTELKGAAEILLRLVQTGRAIRSAECAPYKYIAVAGEPK